MVTKSIPENVLAGGVPARPGVYLFRGPGDEVLYIGTAVDLRRRVGAAGPASGLLFAADRISKLPELEASVDAVRLCHERASLAVLEVLIPRQPLLQRLRKSLEAVGIEPGMKAMVRRRAELIDFLHQLTAALERHYVGELHRYYQERDTARRTADTDDSPF